MEATPLLGEKPRGLSLEDKQLKERFSHPIPGTGVYLDSPPALHETAPLWWPKDETDNFNPLFREKNCDFKKFSRVIHDEIHT